MEGGPPRHRRPVLVIPNNLKCHFLTRKTTLLRSVPVGVCTFNLKLRPMPRAASVRKLISDSLPKGCHRLAMLLLPEFVTQMLAPSKATAYGLVPTANVPNVAPSLERNLVTVLLPAFATQTLNPSNATP